MNLIKVKSAVMSFINRFGEISLRHKKKMVIREPTVQAMPLQANCLILSPVLCVLPAISELKLVDALKT